LRYVEREREEKIVTVGWVEWWGHGVGGVINEREMK